MYEPTLISYAHKQNVEMQSQNWPVKV